jgi:hypothetical protein
MSGSKEKRAREAPSGEQIPGERREETTVDTERSTVSLRKPRRRRVIDPNARPKR